MMMDPTLYDAVTAEEDRRIEEGWKRHNAGRTDIKYTENVLGESDEPVFWTADMIADKPQEIREFIRTGTNILDKQMMGLEKSAVSLVSGLRGGGKSTLLTGWMLNAIQDGHTVVCYSGELTDRNFMRWMILQAAGKANTIESEMYKNYYTVKRDTQLTISHWLGEKFWLYNGGQEGGLHRDRQYHGAGSVPGRPGQVRSADQVYLDAEGSGKARKRARAVCCASAEGCRLPPPG